MTPTYLNLLSAVLACGAMYPLPTAVPSCYVSYRVASPLPPALANSQIPARVDRVPLPCGSGYAGFRFGFRFGGACAPL
jgi:hypothetical protein